MFTMSEPGSSEAAIFSDTDPIGNGDEIEALVRDGFIVRSRADNAEDGEADNNDTTRLEAAISVGAHSISTDYPEEVDGIEYWVEIPEGNPVAILSLHQLTAHLKEWNLYLNDSSLCNNL